jgi:tetratricopeptide (TPR) repeat protein
MNARNNLQGVQRAVITVVVLTVLLFPVTAGLCQPHDQSLQQLVDFTDADAWIRQGLAHNAAGRYQEALDAFLQAVTIAPDNSFAYFNLGTAAALLGRYRESAGYLEKAVKITPDLLPAWSNLGAMYSHLADHDKALAAFRQVLRLQPDNAEAHYRCGLALLALGRHAEARVAYETLLRLDPDLAGSLGEKLPPTATGTDSPAADP